MILLVDNYDSFTFNLYQAIAGLGADVVVHRNDALSVDAMLALAPAGVVLSPGPGRPEDAGHMPALVAALPDEVPLLGVCLGHQALAQHYGGELELDPVPVHGRPSAVHHTGAGILQDLPNPFQAARYHSIRVRRDSLPACLRLTAWTDEGHVMAVEHADLPRFGVQFHPESILTPLGDRLVARFLDKAGESSSPR